MTSTSSPTSEALTPHKREARSQAKRSPLSILLTGSTGQVGFELQRQLCLLGEVMAPSRTQLDLSDAGAVERWLADHRPELIVNAAAHTEVDKAESEPELARRLNAELPEQLAAYAAKQQSWLVHYSSDYVYPSTGSTPWREDDETGPLSVYGQTKLEGDMAIEASGCQHIIFRTSWVYSARGNNFMKTMLRLGRERDALKVVSDQIGAPTPARLIAQVTVLALHKGLTPYASPLTSPEGAHQPEGRSPLTSAQRAHPSQARSALYHLAPAGETSWQGFAQEIFQQAAVLGDELAITPDRVAAIPTAQYPTPAQRPLNSRLCCEELERALGITLPTWQEQLGLTLAEHLDR